MNEKRTFKITLAAFIAQAQTILGLENGDVVEIMLENLSGAMLLKHKDVTKAHAEIDEIFSTSFKNAKKTVEEHTDIL